MALQRQRADHQTQRLIGRDRPTTVIVSGDAAALTFVWPRPEAEGPSWTTRHWAALGRAHSTGLLRATISLNFEVQLIPTAVRVTISYESHALEWDASNGVRVNSE